MIMIINDNNLCLLSNSLTFAKSNGHVLLDSISSSSESRSFDFLLLLMSVLSFNQVVGFD